MERLCSSFGVALRYIGSHAPRENNQPMVSRDWAEQRIHECIVASPCRFCPALNLGLRAISLTLEICEGRAWSQKKATSWVAYQDNQRILGLGKDARGLKDRRTSFPFPTAWFG